MNGLLRRLVAGCSALVLLCCLLVPAAAEGRTSQVIRVGFPLQDGLCEVDENGNYSGYTYEYLAEIAQYTGWELEFVSGEGSTDENLMSLLNMLLTGEIDLMGDLVYSEGMAEQLDYTSQSYGTAYTTLEVSSSNTAISKDSYQTMQGMTVATLTSAKMRVAELELFCKTNQISYELIRFDTVEEMLAALEDGTADAALTTDLTRHPNTRTIAKFSPRPFYFVTTKGKGDVLQKLNKALLNISEVDPAFSATLWEHYFGNAEKNSVFSDADRSYIQRTGVKRVGVMLGGAPYQDWDEKQKAFRGIAVSLLEEIQSSTGLAFELVPVENYAALEALMAEGALDIVASLQYDYQEAGKRQLSLTRPFASSQSIVLGNTAQLESGGEGKRVAVPHEMDAAAVAAVLPRGEVVHYRTLADCVCAVRSGEADYALGDGYSIRYFANLPENRKLHLTPLPQGVQKVSLGVVHPESEELLSVLNKSIIQLSDEQVQAIVYENISYQGQMSYLEYIEANPGKALIALAGVAAVVILSLLAVLITRARTIRQAALDLRKHYQLYALSNDHFFEYDFRKDSLMLSIREEQRDEQDASVFVYENAQQINAKDARRMEFVHYVREREDGTEELRCAFFTDEPRWIRVTTRRVYDGGVPAYVVGKFTDVDEEHREKDELLDLAQKDGLTQVYHAAETRTRIVERLAALPRGIRDAMVIVDIDYFKNINDRYGHFTGDQILQQVAAIMRGVCRGPDFAGRLGGDEFVLYLFGVTPQAAHARCERLRSAILAIALPESTGTVTVSIGAALTTDGVDYDVLYQRADRALYDAKHQGRNRIALAADEGAAD